LYIVNSEEMRSLGQVVVALRTRVQLSTPRAPAETNGGLTELNQLIVCQVFSINKNDFHVILKTEHAKQPSNVEMEGFSFIG
jgi:hypothetical protein